jgi:hypothetical protein
MTLISKHCSFNKNTGTRNETKFTLSASGRLGRWWRIGVCIAELQQFFKQWAREL